MKVQLNKFDIILNKSNSKINCNDLNFSFEKSKLHYHNNS